MIGALVVIVLLLFFGWLLFDENDWGKPME